MARVASLCIKVFALNSILNKDVNWVISVNIYIKPCLKKLKIGNLILLLIRIRKLEIANRPKPDSTYAVNLAGAVRKEKRDASLYINRKEMKMRMKMKMSIFNIN